MLLIQEDEWDFAWNHFLCSTFSKKLRNGISSSGFEWIDSEEVLILIMLFANKK